MKLSSMNEASSQVKRLTVFFMALLILLFPTQALAAESDKWYMKPFEWMIGAFFEYILAPVAGIHEPAHYIFYQGDGLIWGMYNEEQFQNAVANGFNMMLFVVSFMLVSAIIKMGVQNSYGKFSASMKVDMMDNGIKVLIALILLFQFFPIMNIFFTINTYAVSMFENGIQDPTSLTDLGAKGLTAAGDEVDTTEELTFTDLDGNEGNPIKFAIVSFFSFGVSIWFKAYYIQRLFIVSGLIVLAPIWISTMFFPKLQGITNSAFKELWAQIMAQTIHAATFYIYFWLFDGMSSFNDWLTYIIALSVFIPVSESIRFAMGATSENGGRLATIGTLAGAGALIHMGKAAGEIKNGMKTSFMERKGALDGGGVKGSANGSSSPGMSFAKEGGDRQYGGAVNFNSSPNKFARSMRSFGHVASGVGSAVMRTGGYMAGVGINPVAGHFAAEGGAQLGKEGGYSAGVVSYAGAKGIQGKARNAQQGFNQSFEQAKSQGKHPVQATMSGLVGGIKEGTVSENFKEDPIRRNEVLQKIGGALGEASYGRGVGYHMGSEAMTSFGGRGIKEPELAQLNPKRQYAVVTSNKGSFLAEKGSGNQLKPITNMKAGDASLPDGEMVIQEYSIKSSSQNKNIRSFESITPQYAIKKVPKDNGQQWKKMKVEQPAVQPNIQEFLSKEPPQSTPTKSFEM